MRPAQVGCSLQVDMDRHLEASGYPNPAGPCHFHFEIDRWVGIYCSFLAVVGKSLTQSPEE